MSAPGHRPNLLRRLAAYWFLLLVPLVPPLQRRLEASLGQQGGEMLYLWSGRHVRLLFPGLEDLMADVYWLRTVQYYGSQRAFTRQAKYELLEPLVNITVTLDPRYEIAYRYGGVFLAESGHPQAAVALLQRGAAALPESWRLRQELGFFHYYYLGDAQRASEVLLEAARIPGAGFWLRGMAAAFLAHGGRREVSRAIWTEMYRQGEEGFMRENAKLHLQILDALDAADAVTALAQRFASEQGRPPASLEELAQRGYLRGPALDPKGVPFRYDPATGKAEVARESPLWRPAPPAQKSR